MVKPTDEREKVFQQWLWDEGQHPGQLQDQLNLLLGPDLSSGAVQDQGLQLCLKF